LTINYQQLVKKRGFMKKKVAIVLLALSGVMSIFGDKIDPDTYNRVKIAIGVAEQINNSVSPEN
jgi:hypothetical protein